MTTQALQPVKQKLRDVAIAHAASRNYLLSKARRFHE